MKKEVIGVGGYLDEKEGHCAVTQFRRRGWEGLAFTSLSDACEIYSYCYSRYSI